MKPPDVALSYYNIGVSLSKKTKGGSIIDLHPDQRRQVEPNSMWQHRLTRPLHTAHGNSQTKLILNYFKRGSTLNLYGFSVKIYFLHKILGIFDFFFICSCKITCKPMGKFAENLNFQTCPTPPPPILTTIFYDVHIGSLHMLIYGPVNNYNKTQFGHSKLYFYFSYHLAYRPITLCSSTTKL